MGAVTSKVRLYDLAKELNIATKQLIEDVRREGVDVSIPSNSISKELAENIRDKYFPKVTTVPKRAVKVVKKAARPVVEKAVPIETMPEVSPITEIADESNGDRSEDHLLSLTIGATDDILITVRELVADYAGVI